LRAKYATVKIPFELAEKLDQFGADMGYRSRAEIVNDAIRRFIDERKRLTPGPELARVAGEKHPEVRAPQIPR
jgi:metal-responsive CopG/Arc/MetJ family transcriptional regulator